MLIAPSILSADFAVLGKEIELVEKSGADWIHVDVMDGEFVPNITIGPCVVSAVKKHTSLSLDTHLMITKPERFISQFAKSGSDRICFHIEATDCPDKVITEIRKCGSVPGIAIKPNTPVTSIIPYLDKIDMVLVMTVEPGFGGQKFMAEMMKKVIYIKKLKPDMIVEIDGGVNNDTILQAYKCRVDVCVAGTAVFGNDDYKKAISSLKNIS